MHGSRYLLNGLLCLSLLLHSEPQPFTPTFPWSPAHDVSYLLMVPAPAIKTPLFNPRASHILPMLLNIFLHISYTPPLIPIAAENPFPSSLTELWNGHIIKWSSDFKLPSDFRFSAIGRISLLKYQSPFITLLQIWPSGYIPIS